MLENNKFASGQGLCLNHQSNREIMFSVGTSRLGAPQKSGHHLPSGPQGRTSQLFLCPLWGEVSGNSAPQNSKVLTINTEAKKALPPVPPLKRFHKLNSFPLPNFPNPYIFTLRGRQMTHAEPHSLQLGSLCGTP